MAESSSPGERPEPGRILVVDDEPTALKNLRRILEKEGHKVATYANPVRALERLSAEPFDVVISDLRMPHLSGLELLDSIKRQNPGVEVIIVTGFASLEGAVEATKKGAYHFLAKPFTPEELRSKLDEALFQKQMRGRARRRTEAGAGAGAPLIIGSSPPMRRVAEIIAQIAPTDCNVMISGESGTGKELAARAIHAQSKRAAGPWVAFNCAALNRELMENELFGHEKGAFTGADQAKAGLVGGGPPRHHIPGRDRRDAAGHAGEALARLAGAGGAQGGRHRSGGGGHPGGGGQRPEHQGRGGGGRIPAGSVLPPQRG